MIWCTESALVSVLPPVKSPHPPVPGSVESQGVCVLVGEFYMKGGVLQREIVPVSLSAVEGSSGTHVPTPALNKHVVTDSRRVRSLTDVRVGVSAPEIDPIYTKDNVSRVRAAIPSQSRAYILRRTRHVAVRAQQLVTTLSQSVLCNARQAVLVQLTDQLNITGAA